MSKANMCVPTIVFGKVEGLESRRGKGPGVEDDLGSSALSFRSRGKTVGVEAAAGQASAPGKGGGGKGNGEKEGDSPLSGRVLSKGLSKSMNQLGRGGSQASVSWPRRSVPAGGERSRNHLPPVRLGLGGGGVGDGAEDAEANAPREVLRAVHRLFQPGEVFGEGSVFSNHAGGLAVVAKTDIKALWLSKRHFLEHVPPHVQALLNSECKYRMELIEEVQKSANKRLSRVSEKQPDLGGFVSDRSKVYAKIEKALGSWKSAVSKMTAAKLAVRALHRMGAYAHGAGTNGKEEAGMDLDKKYAQLVGAGDRANA